MLSGLVTELARQGRRVCVVARSPERLAHLAKTAAGITPLPLDYRDVVLLDKALRGARRDYGPIERAVCWFHTDTPEIPLAVARHVEGIYCHLLGSAAADPSTPAVIGHWLAHFANLPRLDYRIVVLGFVIEPGAGSRWLTHDEICAGAAGALTGARPLSIIGTAKPWSARP